MSDQADLSPAEAIQARNEARFDQLSAIGLVELDRRRTEANVAERAARDAMWAEVREVRRRHAPAVKETTRAAEKASRDVMFLSAGLQQRAREEAAMALAMGPGAYRAMKAAEAVQKGQERGG
jgi:hypothetical protein